MLMVTHTRRTMCLHITFKIRFTSFPVGTCLASLTLAKFPLPMVLSSLYLPMCGSSDERLRDDPRVLVTAEALLPPPPVELLLFVTASLPCEHTNETRFRYEVPPKITVNENE